MSVIFLVALGLRSARRSDGPWLASGQADGTLMRAWLTTP